MTWDRALTALIIALAALFTLYWGTVEATLAVWSGSEAHRFLYLIPAISLYFIWLRRRRTAGLTPRPSAFGLVLLAGFGFLWLLSRAAFIGLGEQIAFVGMLQALILALLGWRVFQALLFPFLVLWLMVPVGDGVLPSMMDMTTDLTVLGLRLLGRDAGADGTVLITEIGRYGIVEECSALPFIVGNVIIGLVFANLMYRGLIKRFLYVLAAVPVAILANIARTTTVVLITEVTDGRIDLVADHGTYGWVVFAVAVAIQMGIGLGFADRSPADDQRRAPRRFLGPGKPPTSHIAAVFVALLVILSVPRGWAASVFPEAPSAEMVGTCPIAGLPGVYAAAPAWHPVFEEADLTRQRVLTVDGRRVDFALIAYRDQRPDKELVGWPNRRYDERHWRYLEGAEAGVDRLGALPEPRAERLRGARRSRRLVWSWYWVDGRFTGDAAEAKLWQAWAVLRRGDRAGGAVLLSIDERGDPDRARETLRKAAEGLKAPGELMRRAVLAADPRACR